MNAELLSPCEPALRAVGQCLVHFVWQGLLAAGLLGLLMVALRKSTANVRYAVLYAGLIVMAAPDRRIRGWRADFGWAVVRIHCL